MARPPTPDSSQPNRSAAEEASAAEPLIVDAAGEASPQTHGNGHGHHGTNGYRYDRRTTTTLAVVTENGAHGRGHLAPTTVVIPRVSPVIVQANGHGGAEPVAEPPLPDGAEALPGSAPSEEAGATPLPEWSAFPAALPSRRVRYRLRYHQISATDSGRRRVQRVQPGTRSGPRGTVPPGKTAPTKRPRRILLIGLLAVLICTTVTGSTLYFTGTYKPLANRTAGLILGPNTGVQLFPEGDRPVHWDKQERINILLLGLDDRGNTDLENDPGRTDTIILLSVDPVKKDSVMISIPRDLLINIPSKADPAKTEQGKINTAYAVGEIRKPGGGSEFTMQMVEALFNKNLSPKETPLKINYYVKINFANFVKVVNLLNGIDVDVPRPVIDNAYPTEDLGIKRLYIPAGLQHMDGQTALEYVRSRHGDGDLGRAQRQRQVMMAVRDRVLKTADLTKLGAVKELISTFKDTVQTSVPLADLDTIGGMSSLLKIIDGSSVQSTALGDDYWTADEHYYLPSEGQQVFALLPKPERMTLLGRQLFMEPHLRQEAETARIEVVADPNLGYTANEIVLFLQKCGYNAFASAEAYRDPSGQTLLVAHADKPRTRDALGRLLDLTAEQVQTVDGAGDLRLVVGQDLKIAKELLTKLVEQAKPAP